MISSAPMDEISPAPLLLVTGFLGSGKTTLINRFLRCQSGYRLGVLVNEFGQIGIDAALPPSAPEPEVAALLRWALRPAPPRDGKPGGVHAHVHEGGQLSAVSVAEAAPLLEAPLLRLLAEVAPLVLRAKGFVRLRGAAGDRL